MRISEQVLLDWCAASQTPHCIIESSRYGTWYSRDGYDRYFYLFLKECEADHIVIRLGRNESNAEYGFCTVSKDEAAWNEGIKLSKTPGKTNRHGPGEYHDWSNVTGDISYLWGKKCKRIENALDRELYDNSFNAETFPKIIADYQKAEVKKKKKIKKELLKREAKLEFNEEIVRKALDLVGVEYTLQVRKITDKIVRWHTYYDIKTKNSNNYGSDFTIEEGDTKDGKTLRISIGTRISEAVLGGSSWSNIYADSVEKICKLAKQLLQMFDAFHNARQFVTKNCVKTYDEIYKAKKK